MAKAIGIISESGFVGHIQFLTTPDLWHLYDRRKRSVELMPYLLIFLFSSQGNGERRGRVGVGVGVGGTAVDRVEEAKGVSSSVIRFSCTLQSLFLSSVVGVTLCT